VSEVLVASGVIVSIIRSCINHQFFFFIGMEPIRSLSGLRAVFYGTDSSSCASCIIVLRGSSSFFGRTLHSLVVLLRVVRFRRVNHGDPYCHVTSGRSLLRYDRWFVGMEAIPSSVVLRIILFYSSSDFIGSKPIHSLSPSTC